ncbi:MAG: hypothetical protein ACK4P3_07845 [Fimbriimonadaceae bacterium]
MSNDNYYVIGQDGAKYGPAPLTQIARWVNEGRVLGNTQLQSMTGATYEAQALLPHLFGRTAGPQQITQGGAPRPPSPMGPTPGPQPGPGEPMSPGPGRPPMAPMPGQTQGPMPGQPQGPMSQDDLLKSPYFNSNQLGKHQAVGSTVGLHNDYEGSRHFTTSIVCAFLTLLPICPIITAIIGVIYGAKAMGEGHSKGLMAIIFNIVAFFAGVLFSFFIQSALFGW